MKTIRGKLLVYFLVFVVLFQVTAVSIFVSSNQLTNAYDDSFQRFLLLNDISQKSEELFAQTKIFVKGSNVENQADYFRSEEHTSELQSRFDIVCRLLLKKKKKEQLI